MFGKASLALLGVKNEAGQDLQSRPGRFVFWAVHRTHKPLRKGSHIPSDTGTDNIPARDVIRMLQLGNSPCR